MAHSPEATLADLLARKEAALAEVASRRAALEEARGLPDRELQAVREGVGAVLGLGEGEPVLEGVEAGLALGVALV